ncbi:MAG: hypothetical protein V7604_5050, partial [Hyphomicrobiales bacterium]
MAAALVRTLAFRGIIAGLLSLFVGLQVAVPARAATLQSPTGGQVRALVIGIDDYAAQPRLKGAVADATDLSTALRKARVDDLTVLIDRQATRQTIIATLERLAAESKRGDLVFISFAGHGAQLPERTAG